MATQYDPEVEQEAPVSTAQQLTRDSLSPEHRAKAKAKLVQAMTPEAVEGKARPGLWLVEGHSRQYSSLRAVTGLPLWETSEEGSIYTYTSYVLSGTDDTGKEHQIGAVATFRMQKSALKSAQQINAHLFDLPEGQNHTTVTLGTRFIKGKKGSWYVPEVSFSQPTEKELAAARKAGL